MSSNPPANLPVALRSACGCQAPMGPSRHLIYPTEMQAFAPLGLSVAIPPVLCYHFTRKLSVHMPWRRFQGPMNKNVNVITHAVTLIIKAALLAARFSGRVRKRSLKRLTVMNLDTKDREILFLKDKAYQLEMQV